jgi:hypothetical protein
MIPPYLQEDTSTFFFHWTFAFGNNFFYSSKVPVPRELGSSVADPDPHHFWIFKLESWIHIRIRIKEKKLKP